MSTATLLPTAKPAPAKVRPRVFTLGPHVVQWIEANVVHGEGDKAGQPFLLDTFQKHIVNRCYEIDELGERKWDRVVLGIPKGGGKTPLAGAIALAELDGPVQFDGWDENGRPKAKPRVSPDIPVAAASFEQADILFGGCRDGVKQGPLASRLEVYDTEILPVGRSGRLYKVAAVAGTNDGRRPTFFVADEVHEWEGKKERVHMVLSNGRAKRKDSWELSISTAGWDGDSLLARLYERGKANTDPRLLLIWYEADPAFNLDDKEQRAKAIRQANPAVGSFLSLDKIEARYHEIPEHEFRRYYLNQWTSVPEQWIPPEVYDAAADLDRVVEDEEEVVLGFDGSYTRDSTALIGCTVNRPHLFVVGLWERPAKTKEWVVPKHEVVATIEAAVAKYRVVNMPCDDTFGSIWQETLIALNEKGVPCGDWPTRSPSRMSPACGLLWGALKDKSVSHDGDPRLRQHFMNCRTKTDRFGPRIVKEGGKNSEKHIDAAVAGVVAYSVAKSGESTGSVYDERDVRWL